jgi:hypothetical protein
VTTPGTVGVGDAIEVADRCVQSIRTLIDTDDGIPVEMRRQAQAELDAAMERFHRDLARARRCRTRPATP